MNVFHLPDDHDNQDSHGGAGVIESSISMQQRALRGRIAAINGAPGLSWLVTVSCEGVRRCFSYETDAEFANIRADVRRSGLWGAIHVEEIRVKRNRTRPCVLLLSMRIHE